MHFKRVRERYEHKVLQFVFQLSCIQFPDQKQRQHSLNHTPVQYECMPLFWLLKEGESRATCEKNIRSRYWKDEFICGNYRFLMFSQWYDDPQKGATKENLIKWYNTL